MIYPKNLNFRLLTYPKIGNYHVDWLVGTWYYISTNSLVR